MIEQTGNDLVVIADNPAEMVEAQNATIEVVKGKLDHAKKEVEDAAETMRILQESNMTTTAAERMLKRAESRVEFLDKAQQALEAGYVIVPEMPCEVVAIRVKRKPRHQYQTNDYGRTPTVSEETAKGLPAGQGEYADPLPRTDEWVDETKNTKGEPIEQVCRVTNGEWNNEVTLPVEFLRPTVVQRTGMGMMRKIFDEIAVLGASGSFIGARAKKADPMVVGSVIDRVAKRKLWFLVAWFVDTKTI